MQDLILTGPCLPSAREALEPRIRRPRTVAGARPRRLPAGHAETRFVAATGHARLDAALMDALPGLEIISNFGVGVDAIDLAAARARNIRVTNTPEVLNDAVAELTLDLMLALCRRIVAADAHIRAGKWPAGRLPADRRIDRRQGRHPRPRPDRQGDRRPLPGVPDAGRLPRPPRTAVPALRATTPTYRNGESRRLAGLRGARRHRHQRTDQPRGARGARPRRATSSMSAAAR